MEKVEFKTGATREAKSLPRYDLIPPEGLRRLGNRYLLGSTKYAPKNWEKGMPYSVVYNHLVKHLLAWQSGDELDDHLAAVAWGAFSLMHYEKHNNDMDDIHG